MSMRLVIFHSMDHRSPFFEKPTREFARFACNLAWHSAWSITACWWYRLDPWTHCVFSTMHTQPYETREKSHKKSYYYTHNKRKEGIQNAPTYILIEYNTWQKVQRCHLNTYCDDRDRYIFIEYIKMTISIIDRYERQRWHVWTLVILMMSVPFMYPFIEKSQRHVFI